MRVQEFSWGLMSAACLFGAAIAQADDGALDFEDETVRVNYSLGYQIGGDFKRQQVEMDAEAVVQGIRDALEEAEPQMPAEDMQATLVELKRKVTETARKQRLKSELRLIEEGDAYLAQNAKMPGVESTESGLQYRVIEPGDGKRPGPTDRVTVNYSGFLTDGKPFDTGEGVTFQLNRVIKGWTEGLQLIEEGGKIGLVVPRDLAYGNRGVMAHRTLIFEIELIAVEAPGDEAG